MNRSKHVSKENLLKLIHGPEESFDSRVIGEHVHNCIECRKELDALTAQSAIWNKAPTLLKSAARNSWDEIPGKTDSNFNGQPHGDSRSDEESNWHFPINELLDRPKHPEMLGRVGKYDIEREIGRGGMGVVLKAHDAELNRPVAIKILSPHLASHGTARKRFAQEAIAAAGILHPNVIAVYGVSNEGKTPYIVMPLIDGPSLQSLVDQNGPLSEIEIVRAAVQISSGLAAAHAQGLIHRDIKPANILTEGGVQRVIITDFGLARAEDDASLTRTGWLMGTPNYMSPEQTRGQRADGRSDLFSLGSLVYFLATGRLPFRAETPLGVLHRIQNDKPTPVRQVNPQISKTLSEVIEFLLEKTPEARFQTATEVHELLEKHLAYLRQPDISKPPRVPTARSSRPVNQKRIAGGLLLAASMGIAAFGYSGLIPIPFQDVDPSNPTPEILASGTVQDPAPTPKASDKELDSSKARQTQVAQPPKPEAESNHVGAELYAEGERLCDQKRYAESLAAFEKAVEHNFCQAKSNYNIACILARTEQPDPAFEALSRAIELGYVDEDHYRTDKDLDSLRTDPRFENAISRIKELSKSDKVLSKAKSEANRGRYAAAETLCREALEINPANEDAATNLGYAIHLQGRIDEAFPWHERAAKTIKFKAIGNYNLACCHAIKGESEKAFEYLNTAIESRLSDHLCIEDVENDADLKSLLSDPRFKASIEAMTQYELNLKEIFDLNLIKDYDSAGLTPKEHLAWIEEVFRCGSFWSIAVQAWIWTSIRY